MTSNRETFLARVREAVRAGNAAGSAVEIPPRGKTGYQGCGSDAVARFAESLRAAGGVPHIVSNDEAARRKIIEIVENRNARRVLLDGLEAVTGLDIAALLRGLGMEVWQEPAAASVRSEHEPMLFAADVGITGVDFLIAETGSLVLHAQPGRGRSLSLLPPLHIAVATADQIVPDVFDYFERVPQPPSACVTLVTGPSKTGDIELQLVTGVHGPGEVHVVVLRI